jgi:hypothetical protein
MVRPAQDIDLLYFPPSSLFAQYSAYSGNGQSALLQAVRDSLMPSYPRTQIRGDGQVVVVEFDSITMEVVPAFNRLGGGIYICDTNNGGRWKVADTEAEAADLEFNDRLCSGNLRKLIRLLKQWKRTWNVPIKSFHIERLAQESILASSYKQHDWLDWHLRDAFAHMLGRAGGHFMMPGNTGERIEVGTDWVSKAALAHQRSWQACQYEEVNLDELAGTEWQSLLGSIIPRRIE